MPAKRPHNKSRTGCQICRQRRVKCDEARPVCTPCRKHNVRCIFDRKPFLPLNSTSPGHSASVWLQGMPTPPQIDTTASSPSVPQTPPMFGQPTDRLLELQLMNHYTFMHMQSEHEGSPEVREMWAYSIPQTALGCRILMDAVLSQGGQHLHIHRPHDETMRIASHKAFGKTLRNLQEGLSRIGPHNAGSLFAASVMVAFQTFLHWKDPCNLAAPYQLPIEYMVMSRGVLSMWVGCNYDLLNSVMRPAILLSPRQTAAQKYADWQGANDPFIPLKALFEEETRSESTRQILKETLHVIRGLYIAVHEGEPASFVRRRLLTLPSIVPLGFVDFLREQEPRAVILMAHYFAIMKQVEEVWWLRGRAAWEIQGIMSILPVAWHSHMQWPLEVLGMARSPAKSLTPQPKGLSTPVRWASPSCSPKSELTSHDVAFEV